MRDLSFDVELTWSGAGHEGAGRIQSDDVALDLSGPESMGFRGVGTNPEELLVGAVSSCYTATLFAALRRAQTSGRVADRSRQRHGDRLPGCHAVHPDRRHPDGDRRRRRLSARVRGRGLSGARSLPHRPHARPRGRLRGRLSARARRPFSAIRRPGVRASSLTSASCCGSSWPRAQPASRRCRLVSRACALAAGGSCRAPRVQQTASPR